MGLNVLRSWKKSSEYTKETPIKESSPNPNPFKYTLKGYYKSGNYLVTVLKYAGCTSYNGLKILVWNTSKFDVMTHISANKPIDPHFLQENPALIARFPASMSGYKDAQVFVELLNQNKANA